MIISDDPGNLAFMPSLIKNFTVMQLITLKPLVVEWLIQEILVIVEVAISQSVFRKVCPKETV